MIPRRGVRVLAADELERLDVLKREPVARG